ncbi:hypothetical protein GJ744_001498 [Endocarpon pusillum]|uniref:Heterokaryon incompatibility domain-containing protein n=1 Tax=Endocarpon pusillum TaxID=364733 RepID=A0A8H7DZI6_9EURO|nr:hypothetical protein GJ744_001498 [Endocarpon pusillum]
MNICQACHSLFSRRHIKAYKVYHVRPSARNFTRGLETSTGNQACSFSAYLWDLVSTPTGSQYETQATCSEGVNFAYEVFFYDKPCLLLTLNGRKEVGFQGHVLFSHQDFKADRTLLFIPKSQYNTVGIDLASQNTGSVQSLVVAEEWIRRCLSTHENCNRLSETVEGSHPWLPTRLLDVSRQDKESEDTIRLITRPSLQESKGYITLSYCWGEDASFTKLVSARLSAFQSVIELTQLPQTFRDAVQVTRRLNYRYLWIDALCIIQDSPQDWLQEALTMSKVFASSDLNLAAAASKGADDGLFRDREPVGCDLSIGWERLGDMILSKEIYHIVSPNTFARFLKHSKLEQRGWTFQERLLSSRTVHFGEDKIYWECFESSWWEECPDIEAVDLLWKDNSLKQRFGQASRDGRGLDVWNEITERYSGRKLTFSSDKLVALSGIAAQMTRPEDYLAGLWKSGLPQSLLWYTNRPSYPILQYRAPSWSWASIDGEITYAAIYRGSIVAEVLASTVSTNDGSFGPVTDGSLLMKGFVWRAARILPRLRGSCISADKYCRSIPSAVNVHVFWDVVRGSSDSVVFQDNFFFLPVVMREWGTEYMDLCGLVLEPTQDVKGRFRRVGSFKVSDVENWGRREHFRWFLRKRNRRTMACLMAEKSRLRFTIQAPGGILEGVFTPTPLEESNYQDFDGVSQYTIEIV